MSEETAIIKKIIEPDAFQLYLQMGVERSHTRLQELLGDRSVALRTIAEWSSKYNWVAKADEYDKKEHDFRMKLALKQAMKSKVNMLAICQSVLGRFSQELIGEKIVIERQDKWGGITKRTVLKRYHPDMGDAEKAYNIIKRELGEGLPDWGAVKELNLTQIFQQIINNAEKNDQSNPVDSGKSE